jgi:single-stranded DNA-binding protein
MNSVVFSGIIATDPTLRYTKQGTPVASVRLEVDKELGPEKPHVHDYFTCVAYHDQAQALSALTRGTPVAVFGQLHNNNWTSTKDGTKHYGENVVCDVFMPLATQAAATEFAAKIMEAGVMGNETGKHDGFTDLPFDDGGLAF